MDSSCTRAAPHAARMDDLSEPFTIRCAAGAGGDWPGRSLPRLPLLLSAVMSRDDAQWCGDFTVAGYGFGHLKLLRRAAPPGSFGLRGATVHLLLVCDGFHRGVLADPRLRLTAVIGPRGLGELSPGPATEAILGHGELDVVTRPPFSWKFPLTNGRAPELQLGVLHLLSHELALLAGESGGLELYFVIEGDRGRSYINLDGTPGSNFAIGAELFL